MGYAPDFYFDFGYHYSVEEATRLAGVLFLVAMGICALLFLFFWISHVLESYTIYTVAMRRGIKHPWLAWLPFGNGWILGSIADQYQYVSLGQVRNRRKALLGLQIASSLLGLAIFGIYIYFVVEVLIKSGGDYSRIDMESVSAMSLLATLVCLAIYVLAVLILVFRYISLYNLFASCRPGCKVAFILLSIFLCVTEPFLVFACRNKDLGMPPKKTDPVPPILIDPPVFEE